MNPEAVMSGKGPSALFAKPGPDSKRIVDVTLMFVALAPPLLVTVRVTQNVEPTLRGSGKALKLAASTAGPMIVVDAAAVPRTGTPPQLAPAAEAEKTTRPPP